MTTKNKKLTPVQILNECKRAGVEAAAGSISTAIAQGDKIAPDLQMAFLAIAELAAVTACHRMIQLLPEADIPEADNCNN